jgi:hypothetical protein
MKALKGKVAIVTRTFQSCSGLDLFEIDLDGGRYNWIAEWVDII